MQFNEQKSIRTLDIISMSASSTDPIQGEGGHAGGRRERWCGDSVNGKTRARDRREIFSLFFFSSFFF